MLLAPLLHGHVRPHEGDTRRVGLRSRQPPLLNGAYWENFNFEFCAGADALPPCKPRELAPNSFSHEFDGDGLHNSNWMQSLRSEK